MTTSTQPNEDHRCVGSSALPFALIGSMGIVSGGLLSAVTASAPSEHTAWLSAYLVLVVGVAQIGLGAGQAHLAPPPVPRGLVMAEVVAWNLGSAGVAVGAVAGPLWLVDLGGALLVVALVLLVHAARGATPQQRWATYIFRALVLVLLVSVPIGLILARIG